MIAQHGVALAPFSEAEGKEQGLIKIGQLKDVYEEIWLISAERKLENSLATKVRDTF